MVFGGLVQIPAMAGHGQVSHSSGDYADSVALPESFPKLYTWFQLCAARGCAWDFGAEIGPWLAVPVLRSETIHGCGARLL